MAWVLNEGRISLVFSVTMQTDTRLEGVVHIVLISVLGTEFDFMAVYDKIDVVVVWVDEKDFILVD